LIVNRKVYISLSSSYNMTEPAYILPKVDEEARELIARGRAGEVYEEFDPDYEGVEKGRRESQPKLPLGPVEDTRQEGVRVLRELREQGLRGIYEENGLASAIVKGSSNEIDFFGQKVRNDDLMSTPYEGNWNYGGQKFSGRFVFYGDSAHDEIASVREFGEDLSRVLGDKISLTPTLRNVTAHSVNLHYRINRR
jgi:hypothetical protein